MRLAGNVRIPVNNHGFKVFAKVVYTLQMSLSSYTTARGFLLRDMHTYEDYVV